MGVRADQAPTNLNISNVCLLTVYGRVYDSPHTTELFFVEYVESMALDPGPADGTYPDGFDGPAKRG